MNRNIHNLDRYDYELDKKFISSYPLKKRENSKLLVYRDNKIVDSDFKIKFASKDKEKISLNYQGCYKNKVCYPSKMKNIVIKYNKKSISSVKID